MKVSFEIDTNSTEEIEKIIEFLNTLKGHGTSVCMDAIDSPAPQVQEVPPPVPKEDVPPPPMADTTPPPPPPPAAPTNGTWPQLGADGVLVDSEGLPWDERINSDNRKCVAKDGRWRKRRNCDPQLYGQVVAELKSAKIGEQVKAMEPAKKADPGPAELTFPAFMEWVVTQDPKYKDAAGLNELVKSVGLDSIASLAVHQQKIPELVKMVQAG